MSASRLFDFESTFSNPGRRPKLLPSDIPKIYLIVKKISGTTDELDIAVKI